MEELNNRILACDMCPRLRTHCMGVKQKYDDTDYWRKPVPGFGDRDAELVIIGMQPSEHGANRTGRPFVGDTAGELLYKALHRYGFTEQEDPAEISEQHLRRVYLTNVLRCAAPKHKPYAEETDNCREFLWEELEYLERKKVILLLGETAHRSFKKLLRNERLEVPGFEFEHGAVYEMNEEIRIVVSYHPSKSNVIAGRMSEEDWFGVFEKVQGLLGVGE